MIGERIFLRPIESEDIDILNEWKNNEELFKYLGGGYKPTSKTEQKNWILEMSKITSTQRFIICEKRSETPIGMIGLYSISLINRNSEIGLYLGNKNLRGKGYAGEALDLLEKYAFRYLNLKKLKLNVVESNTNAVDFWKKNNYMVKGTLSEERYIDGKFLDLLIMEKFLV